MTLRQATLRRRIKACTWIVIVGLVLSGVTAIPLESELRLLARWTADGEQGGMSAWIARVRDGLIHTNTQYPFMAYGTDWLAFGHLMMALAFAGALRHPVRNAWLFQFGMMASAAVVPWALVFGEVRGIPLGWRLIDCLFGIFSFVPCWLAHRWARELEHSMRASGHAD
jgi:hypothetical protein